MSPTALDVCLAVVDAQARLARVLDEPLGNWHGLDVHDLVLLMRLQRAPRGRLGLKPLAAQLSMPVSALLKQVLPLEKTGLVARESVPGEAGSMLVLRPPGRQLAREAADTAEAAARRALAGWPAERREMLHGWLLAVAARPS